MKKISKVIIGDETSIAFQEGIKAYQRGVQSWSNPYIPESDELTRAWLDGWLEGWKTARAESHKRCHNEALPVQGKS